MFVGQLLSLLVVVALSGAIQNVVAENAPKETEAIVVNSRVAYPYDCDCGPGEDECEMKKGEKICTCKEGYSTTLKQPGTCIEECSAVKPCHNLGVCKEKICDCMDGTEGDLCETATECKLGKCGNDTDCVYDTRPGPTIYSAICVCKDPTLELDSDGRCKVCDCGVHAETCHFKDGNKECTCKKGYSEINGMCEKCDCGREMIACSFYSDSTKACDCAKGYYGKDGICTRCDCGYHGKRCFFSDGSKICLCNDGYDELLGTCTECYCGVHAWNRSCYYYEGSKHCNCTEGYANKLGYCRSCDCGKESSKCFYDVDGKKGCVCSDGYEFSLDDKVCNKKKPWFSSPLAIVGLIVCSGLVLFGTSFLVYQKCRRQHSPRPDIGLRTVS